MTNESAPHGPKDRAAFEAYHRGRRFRRLRPGDRGRLSPGPGRRPPGSIQAAASPWRTLAQAAALLAADFAFLSLMRAATRWAVSHRGPFGSLAIHQADLVWDFIVMAPLSVAIIGLAASGWLLYRKRRGWLVAIQVLGMVLLIPLELLGWSLLTEGLQLTF